MKYCVPYYKNFKYMEDVDEIIVPYSVEDIDFIKSLTSKEKVINGMVIIDVQDIADFIEHNCIGIFQSLQDNYPDVKFKLRFNNFNTAYEDLYLDLKVSNIDFFFATWVRDWDTFNGFMQIGVSDIYIVEELAFSLGEIGPVAHANNISIRVFANVAQSRWVKERSIKSFFIRPEDVSAYEGYVDVIEFFGDKKVVFEVMYKAYAINQYWFGPLKEIIVGLESEVDSRSLPFERFGMFRVNCQKRCNHVNSNCSICETMTDVANALKHQNIYFTN